MEQSSLKRIFSFLNARQLAALTSLLSEEPQPAKIMTHELAHKLGVDASYALMIIAILGSEGITDNKLLIYHTCTKVVVAALPLENGFPPIPWKCLRCRKKVKSLDQLRFSHMAIARPATLSRTNSGQV